MLLCPCVFGIEIFIFVLVLRLLVSFHASAWSHVIGLRRVDLLRCLKDAVANLVARIRMFPPSMSYAISQFIVANTDILEVLVRSLKADAIALDVHAWILQTDVFYLLIIEFAEEETLAVVEHPLTIPYCKTFQKIVVRFIILRRVKDGLVILA